MAYIPQNVPTNPAEIPGFLRTELQRIAQAFGAGAAPQIQHVAPGKILAGTAPIVVADGVDWNPGSGPGAYCYYGGSWHFLG